METYLKVFVRSEDAPELVYGWVGVYYRQMPDGEIYQFTLGAGSALNYHDWAVNFGSDENEHVSYLTPTAYRGGQLDGRMKKYKEFERDTELRQQVREAAQKLIDKAKTSFDDHKSELERRRDALERQLDDLDALRRMAVTYENEWQLKERLRQDGAPNEYFDLRKRELQVVYGDLPGMIIHLRARIRSDVEAVQRGLATWDSIMERCRREVEGG